MPEIDDLIEWAATAEAGLAEPVLRTTLAIVVDDLAAMLGAHAEAEVRAVSGQAGGPAEATVVGVPGLRAERRRAALANAVAANWTELDGGYRPATCHGLLYTLPAALAETEATGGSLGDLLTSVTIGYEVVTRVARAYRPRLPLVLHPHATLSPIGAAAALATVRRLPAEVFGRAVLAAASMSMNGPFGHATEGATVRNAWAAAGAQLGFVAVDVATAGLTASPGVLEEVFGSRATANPGALTDGLGERHAVQDGYQKPYACCQYLHSSVEAAARIAVASAGARVERIEVRAHPLAAALHNADPKTTLAGRFSLPHAVATVLAAGNTGAPVFADAALWDPTVVRLREQVVVEEWADPPAPPRDRPARVRVALEDGRTLEETILSASGGPDRPLSRTDLLAKYEALTADGWPGFADRARVLTDPDLPLDLGAGLGGVLAHLLGQR